MQVVPDNSGDIVLAIMANGENISGSERIIQLPVGSADSLTVAPDLNIAGDATIDSDGVITDFDPLSAYTIFISYFNGLYTGVIRKHIAIDIIAPTVLSATVSALDADALVVVFSQPVYLPSITGLSLSFSVGTPQTIVALTSGNGTDTLTFSLSGNLGGSETCTFVISSNREVQDLNGNLVTVGSTSVTLSFGLSTFGFTHEWRADRGRTGDPVSQLNDQIGIYNLSQGTVGNRPDYQAGPPEVLVFDATDYLNNITGSGSNPANPNSDFSLVAYFDSTGMASALHAAICLSSSNSVGLFEVGYNGGSGVAFARHFNDAASAVTVSSGAITGGKMTVCFKREGANMKISVNGGAFASTAHAGGSIATTALNVSMGSFLNTNGTGDHFNGPIYHTGLKNSAMADADALQIHNLMVALHS